MARVPMSRCWVAIPLLVAGGACASEAEGTHREAKAGRGVAGVLRAPPSGDGAAYDRRVRQPEPGSTGKGPGPEGGGSEQGEPAVPVSTNPASLDVPTYPGAEVEPLGGRLQVDGRPTSVSMFETDDSPDQVVAFFRSRFESHPVDRIERPVPDGKILAIFDNRSGRRLVIEARRSGERTSVTWGWSAPSGEGGDDLAIPLPEEFIWLSRVDDHLGGIRRTTRVGFSALPPEDATRQLAETLGRAGWAVEPGSEGGWRLGGLVVSAAIHGEGGGSRIELNLQHEGRGP